MDISIQLSSFYGYPFGYPWISMDIDVLTCYGFSIQGSYITTCVLISVAKLRVE